jgi:hypothetical protein
VKPQTMLFARGGSAGLFLTLAGLGVVLILSMPWAGRVADFFTFPWSPSPLAFFLGMLVLAAVHAANRGAVVEMLPQMLHRQVAFLPIQVLLLHLTLLPYVAACRALVLASDFVSLWLAWLYSMVVSVAVAAGAYHLSLSRFQRGRHAFFPILFAIAAYFLVPLVLLAIPPLADGFIISPFGGLLTILHGARTGLLVGIFLIPSVGATLLVATALARRMKEASHPHG